MSGKRKGDCAAGRGADDAAVGRTEVLRGWLSGAPTYPTYLPALEDHVGQADIVGTSTEAHERYEVQGLHKEKKRRDTEHQ